MVKEGNLNNDSFSMLRAHLQEERKRNAKLHLEAVQKSIEELIPCLSEGMKIGLENRYWYHEIPSHEEMSMLLDKYSEHVGYWHDTGHAHVLETYGLYKKGEFIHSFGDRLIGVHFHDAINAGDHMGVGTGDVDFSTLCQYMKDDVIRVFEYNPSVKVAEIVDGKYRMKQMAIIE
jgi:sugar phosphate isomerase/epimerase